MHAVFGQVAAHLKAFFSFYMSSRRLQIESLYGSHESLSRILKMGQQGQVRVRELSDNALLVAASHHAVRANVLPVFTGMVEERDGSVRLVGQVGLAPGIRGVVAILVFAVFIYAPLTVILGSAQSSAEDISILISSLLGLLVFGFLLGKNDTKIIIHSLKSALEGTESVLK